MKSYIRAFVYQDGKGQSKDQEILVLNEERGSNGTVTDFQGISLKALEEAEKQTLLEAKRAYDTIIEAVQAKAFRRFKENRIIRETL